MLRWAAIVGSGAPCAPSSDERSELVRAGTPEGQARLSPPHATGDTETSGWLRLHSVTATSASARVCPFGSKLPHLEYATVQHENEEPTRSRRQPGLSVLRLLGYLHAPTARCVVASLFAVGSVAYRRGWVGQVLGMIL